MTMFEHKIIKWMATENTGISSETIAFDMLWLTMNYRQSYYDQLIDIAKTVKSVHQAIRAEKPIGELLRRSNRAVKACRGL